MRMCGAEAGRFPRTVRRENGVVCVDVGIPGEPRRGVLSPETLADLQNGGGTAAALWGQALRAGDYAALRAMPPADRDLTSEPVTETELCAADGQTELPITCYRTAAGAAARPALVYLHGGGFRFGSRRSAAHSTRLLAQLSGAAVFSVEYRLAPEYPFPCATRDAWCALRWVCRNAERLGIDRSRVLIGGDSAGGNLAAACARRDRNMRTGLLKGQLLVYPVLSQREPNLPGYRFSLSDYQICEEHRRWVQAEILSLKQTMDSFRLYTRTDREDLSPDASPLLDKNFAGLPPTWLFCAEFDSLTQQARTYAARLAAAGVPVCLTVYRGMAHGFMNRLGRYPQAELLHQDMVQALGQASG